MHSLLSCVRHQKSKQDSSHMIFTYLIYYQAVNGQPCQLSHFPGLREESKVLQLLEHPLALPL